jgi:hypothetical protein
MEPSIFVAIISPSASVVIAAFTFWFTKRRDREAEIRRQKLEYYKELIHSLSDIVGTDNSPEGQKNLHEHQII